MSDVLMKPKEFQEEVDGYNKASDAVGSIAYAINVDDVSLDSADLLMQCITEMNGMITDLKGNGDINIRNLQNIKSTFLHLDKNMGDITVIQHILGAKP